MRARLLPFLFLLWLPASSAFAATAGGNTQHTTVVKPDGTVWGWGTNGYGQVGDGTTLPRAVPTAVTGLSGVTITAVAVGTNHVLALASDGTIWAWGFNGSGQIGDGTTTTRTSPVHLTSLTSVVAVAAGGSHSMALRSDGTVYTWGNNANGQLGNNSTTSSSTPVLVSATLLASAIGAGGSHSLLVRTDGTVWAWGSNTNGQLGDGSTTQRLTPVQMSSVSGAAAVVAGTYHSTVLLSTGTLKATGYNGYGQLGDGTTTQRTTAVAVSTLTSVTRLASGDSHVLAAKSDGTLWVWGNNYSGQLGLGTTTNVSTPTAVTGASGIDVLGAGSNHSVVASTAGVVSVCGANASRQLGDGTTASTTTWLAISDPGYVWKVGTPTFSIPAGTYSTNQSVVVNDATSGAEIHYTLTGVDPTLSDPQVTNGGTVTVTENLTLKARGFKTGLPTSNIAAAVYVLQVGTPAISPVSGTYTSARTVTMTIATTGATIRYTLDGSTPSPSSTAYTGAFMVGTTTTVKAAGFKTNWTTSGTATATYTMNFGVLPTPSISPAAGTYTTSVAVSVTSLPGATIRYTLDGSTPTTSSLLYTGPVSVTTTATFTARGWHPDYQVSAPVAAAFTIAVDVPTFTPAGGTYAAGQRVTVSDATPGATIRYTVTGSDPTTTDPVIASGSTLVVGTFTLKARAFKSGCVNSAVGTATYALSSDLTPRAIAAGTFHTLALRQDGTVWAVGQNSYGQLGDGSSTNRWLPVPVSGATGSIGIAAGETHSVALHADGYPLTWGANTNGQLGDGTTAPHVLPAAVPGLTGVTRIAAGSRFTLALQGTGTLKAWGDNYGGQLGDGTQTSRSSPVTVTGLTTVVAIAAGGSHALALLADGSVVAWGANESGQLGDGTTTRRTTPVPVPGLSNVVMIAAGYAHSVAVTADGVAWAWGDNDYGQLGFGDGAQRLQPTAVPGLADVTGVTASAEQVLWWTADGHVFGVGRNSEGQLGDGTLLSRSTPTAIPLGAPVVRVAAGVSHGIALTADGVAITWGSNGFGQLADGTTLTRPTPVDVSGPGLAWKTATPVLSLASGVYASEQSVTVTTSDPAATLHLTTDGTEPTEASAVIASGSVVAVTQSVILKVRGWRPDAPASVLTTGSYELKATTPVVTPSSGVFVAPPTIAITTTTAGAALRYTVDGTEPDAGSPLYTAPFVLEATATVKARAERSGWTTSDSGYASYAVTGGPVATPVITPAGGTFTTPPLVVITCATTDATIRYTTDGTDPDPRSAAYVHALVPTVSTTIKARAFRARFTPSAVAAATFALDAAGTTAMPTVAPAGGWFAVAQTVTIAGPPNATLRYTTSGVDPTDTDPEVPANHALVVDRSLVLKVRAWVAGQTVSAVRRADFVVLGALAAGYAHSVALKADGSVWTWGRNFEGQLGTGTTTQQLSPIQVQTGARAVAAGGYHTVSVGATGAVSSWGRNSSGQLGLGDTGARYAPTLVPGLSDITMVAAGDSHTLALRADGSVWAFGANDHGQLGDGTTTQRSSPVQVLGLTGIVAIAARGDHSMAIQADGAAGGFLWSWGSNTDGQVGDGSFVNRLIPVQLGALVGVNELAAGHEVSAVRLADGSVWTWGTNSDGQLGTGPLAVRSQCPVQAAVLAGVRRLAAGASHLLAADTAGRPWGWGHDAYGELGYALTGSPRQLTLARPLTTFPSPALMVGGSQYTLVGTPDGTLVAAGINSNGQLGLGTTETTVSTPATVPGFTLVANGWLASDPDGDHLSTWREYLAGTDPLNADSNGNGVPDDVEGENAAAADPDTDGDGVPNIAELAAGTDPFLADTDGDGVSDLTDAFPLDATRSDPLPVDPDDHTPPAITLIEPTNAVPIP